MGKLERNTLSENLANLIQSEIEEGVWQKQVPGYRTLCKKYEVSRPTCQRALEILQARGILEPPRQSKPRKIIAKSRRPKQTKSAEALLVVTDTLHSVPSDNNILLSRLLNYWKSRGGSHISVSADLQRASRPFNQLMKWIETHNCTHILLHIPPKSWVKAAEKTKLPCYALGGDLHHGGGKISGNGFPLATFTANFLKRTKHKKVLIPCAGASGLELVKKVISEKILEAKESGDISENLQFWTDGPYGSTPDDWMRWWPVALYNYSPSLIILSRAQEAISLSFFCMANKIRIPEDLSYIVTADSNTLAWLVPLPTRYRYPDNKAQLHFRTWVKKGCPPDFIKLFEAEFFGGKSFLDHR